MTAAGEALSRTLLLTRDYLPRDRVSDRKILGRLQSTEVCLVANRENLLSGSGQSAVIGLAGQLLMMGMTVKVVLPEVNLVAPQPPMTSLALRTGLVELGTNVVPGASVRVVTAAEAGDLVFVFGDTPWRGPSEFAWRVFGGGWEGGISPVKESAPRWQGEFPVGALAAATIAAAEPYKAALRPLFFSEFLRAVSRATGSFGPGEVLRGPIRLGHLDLVSGGAITQAMLHVLLRVPALRGAIRVFEPDVLDISNLNRYPLALVSNLRLQKAKLLSRWGSPNITIRPDTRRFTKKLADGERLAPLIAVGADHIPTRWVAQGVQPAWLGIGATSHFNSVVSDHLPGEACAGCLHPEGDDDPSVVPTIGFVSYWAGLALASKLLRYLTGHRAAASEQVLRISGLLLDGAYTFHPHPLRRNPQCPVVQRLCA